MTAIVERAGLVVWDDLFQTLRRNCETQWAMTVPQRAVSAWIGHSQLVSQRHYLQLTDELYKFVHQPTPRDGGQEIAAESAAVKPGTGSQDEENDTLAEIGDPGESTKKPDNCRVILSDAISCEVVRGGVEPPTHGFSVHHDTPNNTGESADSDASAAHMQRGELAGPENLTGPSADELRAKLVAALNNLNADELFRLSKLFVKPNE